MLAGLATEGHLQLSESAAELVLIGTHKLGAFLAMEHEVELRDGLDLEGLASLSVVVRLYRTENDMLILVCASGPLVRWLEAHARSTTW